MSDSIFVTGVAVSFAYLLFRFIEMRFILKENKPLKVLARDTLLVYLSVVLGHFILQQFGNMDISVKVPQVFTNEPDF